MTIYSSDSIRAPLAHLRARVRLIAGLVALGWALAPSHASAQAQIGAVAQGYAFGGTATVSGFFGGGSSFCAGGGGEWLIGRGPIGVGAEAGLIDYIRVLSVNASVHFGNRNRTRPVEPFVTAGYTSMTGEGEYRGWNAGAGVIFWWGRHAGLRTEVRDQVRPDRRGTVQYLTLRVGVAFR